MKGSVRSPARTRAPVQEEASVRCPRDRSSLPRWPRPPRPRRAPRRRGRRARRSSRGPTRRTLVATRPGALDAVGKASSTRRSGSRPATTRCSGASARLCVLARRRSLPPRRGEEPARQARLGVRRAGDSRQPRPRRGLALRGVRTWATYALGIGILSALRQGIEGKFKDRLSRAREDRRGLRGRRDPDRLGPLLVRAALAQVRRAEVASRRSSRRPEAEPGQRPRARLPCRHLREAGTPPGGS